MNFLSANFAAMLWFVAGLILILVEFLMPGLIIIFFGAGAWIVSAAAYFKWTMIIPQSMSDLAGIIATATSVISKTGEGKAE